MSIQNFSTNDPFSDETDLLEETNQVGSTQDHIHIRIQQRNGRKTLTTLQGLAKEYDLKKILKEMKKDFACNGNIVEHEKFGRVIQLQGDQRQKIYQFLKDNEVDPKSIVVHGF